MIDVLADPNVAYILLAATCLAFLAEAANPGMSVPGTTGIVLLVLAGLGLLRLPTTPWGLVLIAVALVLFGAEQFSKDRWAGPLAGTLILMLGGLLLFSEPVGVNRWVLLLTAMVVAAGAVVTARTARRVRMARRPTRHPADHRGRILTLDRADGTRGQVKLDGTWWTVQSDEELTSGQHIRVTDRTDLVLFVEPVEENPWTH